MPFYDGLLNLVIWFAWTYLFELPQDYSDLAGHIDKKSDRQNRIQNFNNLKISKESF